MLHAHPRIAIPPETTFLMRCYRRQAEYGDLRVRANRERLARDITNPRARTRIRDLGLDREDLVREIVDGEPSVSAALSAPFRLYATRHGKPRWGHKRPAYYQFIPELLTLFPKAQIVSIIRDGRDCVASLKDARWYKEPVPVAVSTWTMAVDAAREASALYGSDTFYELRYEDLVTDAEAELRRLCDFLGEAYDDAMRQAHRVAPTAVPERKDWHRLTHEPVTDRRIATFQERLTPAEISLCEWAMGDRLVDRGYALTGTPSPKMPERLGYRLVDSRRRVTAWRRRRLDRRIARSIAA